MIAAKHLDPVIGVDIHLIQPPGPVPPVPIPHPFVGFLMDPADYVPIVGSTVLINNMHRAQAGTAGKCVPPHIPIGGVFVPPPPGNECEMFMGSATVECDGDALSYMGLPALSCQSVGMPSIPRVSPKKKTIPKCLMLPTSQVLAIPAGPPVMVGGPPTISIMGMAMKAGAAALGKLAKAFKKIQKKSKRWKAISKRAHEAAKKAMDKLGVPPSARNRVHRAICSVTGHPVDIATGKVFTDAIDFQLPGPLPLVWERVWFSTSTYNGPLGHGWHHSYDLGLVDEGEAVAVRLPDGRPVAFPPIAPGESVFDRTERLTLSRSHDGYSVRNAEGISFHFGVVTFDSPVQKLVAVTNRQNFRIDFSYDKHGYLSEIRDSSRRLLPVTTDQQGRITEIRAPHPDEPRQTFPLVRYEYDHSGLLVATRDPLDHAMTFHYSPGGLLLHETNRNGLTFHFEYDADSPDARCIHTWGDGGIYERWLHYDTELRRTIVTNSLGQKTVYDANQNGVITTAVDAAANATQTIFNEFHQVVGQIDEVGFETVFEYDARGNRISTTFPDGSALAFNFDEHDLPVSAVDGRGGLWTWTHNDQGQIVQRSDPTGATLSYAYRAGLLDSITDPAGQKTTLTHDTAGNLESITLPTGGAINFKSDVLGRCILRSAVLGATTLYTYDLKGRVTAVVSPRPGLTSETIYDPEGNILESRAGSRTVRMEWQGLSRVRSRSDGQTTLRFLYDTEENLIAVKNPAGDVYRFELDEKENVARILSFGKTRTIFTRDALGRAVRVEKASGTSVSYEYTALSQVSRALYSDGVVHSYLYDQAGDLIEANSPGCTVTLERDAVGRVLAEVQNDEWVRTQFDSNGLKASMSSSLGAKEIVFRNEIGRPIAHQRLDTCGEDNIEWLAKIERSANGWESTRTLTGGITSQWQRTEAGLPKQQNIMFSGGLRSVSYNWNKFGSIESIHESAFGLTVFGYSQFGDLQSATRDGLPEEIRVADQSGNFANSFSTTTQRFGPDGQILEARTPEGLTYYRYDLDGNLVARDTPQGLWEYRWSAAGNLVEVVRPDGVSVQFTYDAFGRRRTKTIRDTTISWTWDQDLPIHEKCSRCVDPLTAGPDSNEPGELQTSAITTWIYDPDTKAPVACVKAGKPFSFIADHLGSPASAYDESGALVWDATISLYGEQINRSGDPSFSPFRFPGQYADAETGLVYNRYRYYDPQSGIYLSQDPIGLLGGHRLYGYVRNPTLDTDPFGLAPGDSAALDRALGGAVGDQHQAHHLIPCQVWDNNQAMFDNLGMERNAASNGLLMPSDATIQGGRVGHVGSHPRYNQLVADEVDSIRTSLADGLITRGEAREMLDDLQVDLRQRIRNQDPSIPTTASATNPCKLA